MRNLVHILGTSALVTIGGAGVYHLATLNEKAPTDQGPAENHAPAKDYVQIDGKLYERNARGVYYIDGIATFVKNEKATAPIKPKGNLGPALDPSIYKEAMGLEGDDQFFKTSADSKDR